MIEFLSSPLRSRLIELVGSVRESLWLATPFMKQEEAAWVADALSQKASPDRVALTILTDFRADSVLSGSLDVEALCLLTATPVRAQIVSVPHLHAKVYIADRSNAVITSANLTTAGLDRNLEYGVEIRSPELVARVLSDMGRYARLGSPVAPTVLRRLSDEAQELRRRFQDLQHSASARLRDRFDEKLRETVHEFIATQVGDRSANAVFSEAILFLLSQGPKTTEQLHPEIQRLLPELCDDSVELVINGEHFGKKWKHAVRNAQQSLKRGGRISFDGQFWFRI